MFPSSKAKYVIESPNPQDGLYTVYSLVEGKGLFGVETVFKNYVGSSGTLVEAEAIITKAKGSTE